MHNTMVLEVLARWRPPDFYDTQIRTSSLCASSECVDFGPHQGPSAAADSSPSALLGPGRQNLIPYDASWQRQQCCSPTPRTARRARHVPNGLRAVTLLGPEPWPCRGATVSTKLGPGRYAFSPEPYHSPKLSRTDLPKPCLPCARPYNLRRPGTCLLAGA